MGIMSKTINAIIEIAARTGGDMRGVTRSATVKQTENIAHMCKHRNDKN